MTVGIGDSLLDDPVALASYASFVDFYIASPDVL